ncbi:MAG TPA: SAM-dependent methyltransferase [Betaproteobacteria bacterium]|nr:SAM-dependent methyltransferase [Betaproteobacteria bacterium]
MNKLHWENVYTTKPITEVSWYRTHLEQSLALIEQTGAGPEARIIDVGGGASTLVDDLLAADYRHLTILDISAKALAEAKTRLGKAAARVAWLEADITQAALPAHHYDIWHDRAVFHFLTQPEERRRYVAAVQHAVKPGGHIIMACFGPAGPRQCSGLDIVRYHPEQLHGEFGGGFRLVKNISETHLTPAGKEQQFIYCYCKMG